MKSPDQRWWEEDEHAKFYAGRWDVGPIASLLVVLLVLFGMVCIFLR